MREVNKAEAYCHLFAHIMNSIREDILDRLMALAALRDDQRTEPFQSSMHQSDTVPRLPGNGDNRTLLSMKFDKQFNLTDI